MAAHQYSAPFAFNFSSGVHSKNLFALSIGTWNVRTLNSSVSDFHLLGKSHQLVGELERYRIDLCCLAEVKWPGEGTQKVGEWDIVYSGSTVGKKLHGVGIAIGPNMKSHLCQTLHLTDRLMACVFNVGKIKLHLVSVYAPTEDKSEQIKDQFYATLQEYIDQVPVRDKLIVCGDFNAQLGGQERQAWSGALGKFCLGKKATENGTKLLSFCASNQLVRNTFFQ